MADLEIHHHAVHHVGSSRRLGPQLLQNVGHHRALLLAEIANARQNLDSGEFHGTRGPAARALAGQQSEYLEAQLRAFIGGKRTSPFMPKVAGVLSPPMQKALASHFNKLNPKPLGGAPTELVAKGKAIYEEGVPEANIAPCSSCHGASAKGDGQFPRLAGQLHDYISARLARWSRERQERPEADPNEMESIARSLTEFQIFAVAAYLSCLE